MELDPNELRGPIFNKDNFSLESEFRSILIDYLHCHWLKNSGEETASLSKKRSPVHKLEPTEGPSLGNKKPRR
ncbi:hypothetical protein BLOT_004965 [Blomia tropicalis]|nr:hypothetical protein BLOT_004965 [Blomia tropicalis]